MNFDSLVNFLDKTILEIGIIRKSASIEYNAVFQMNVFINNAVFANYRLVYNAVITNFSRLPYINIV